MDDNAGNPTRIPVPRIGDNGRLVCDQGFFLALARCGKQVWNRWRADNPVAEGQPFITVTFAGTDFRTKENSAIDFSGFEFGHSADCSDAAFGHVDLSGASFGDYANFSRASFDSYSNLSGASFGDLADFSGASFGDHTNLSGARFTDFANFSGASFDDAPNLCGASFGAHANLSGASFGRLVNLSSASFGDYANLSGTSFADHSIFSGVSFGVLANLSGARFGNFADLSGLTEVHWRTPREELLNHPPFKDWPDARKQEFLQWPADIANRPDSFTWISFAGAHFRGRAGFSGRTAEEGVDFESVRFDLPPSFDSLDNLNLYGAHIDFSSGRRFWLRGWTTKSGIAVALRRLRKLAEDTKNHDLERDLYVEERKAERGIYLYAYFKQGQNEIAAQLRNVEDFRSAMNFAVHAAVSLARAGFNLCVHLAWIGVMGGYWLVADYGRSFVRPLAALIASVFLFHAAYRLALAPSPSPAFWPRAVAALERAITWPKSDDSNFTRAVRAFSLANAVPFAGALTLERDIKDRVICGDPQRANCANIPPLRFQILALGQTIFSALCLFFIALALRNYLRMK